MELPLSRSLVHMLIAVIIYWRSYFKLEFHRTTFCHYAQKSCKTDSRHLLRCNPIEKSSTKLQTEVVKIYLMNSIWSALWESYTVALSTQIDSKSDWIIVYFIESDQNQLCRSDWIITYSFTFIIHEIFWCKLVCYIGSRTNH